MNKIEIFAIGVMSGTSLDGVDLCYVKFNVNMSYTFDILKTATVPYPSEWKSKLVAAFSKEPKDLNELHHTYGVYLGELIQQFIAEHQIEKIDFIASHGHTIFHKPEENFTLQIGSGEMIAQLTGHQVVSDFRTQDVLLGGQGAPLVPVGDRLLFNEFDYCLNLGGFANISYEQKNARIAFDICPINIVLNHYTQQQGMAYDDGGQLASKGTIDQRLLKRLNELPYYLAPAPKSLGYEWVHEIVLPLVDQFELSLNDVLATFVEHAAYQISSAIQEGESVLVTGGGAYNSFFMERLKAMTSLQIIIPSSDLVEYKEALIFALLGLLRLEGKINVLKEVTGASKDHSSGKISQNLT